MSSSYVFGNAPQLLELTQRERSLLDESPYVAVLNDFPPHWRILGFRPTVWIVGDCFNTICRSLLRSRAGAISHDTSLFERLKTLFICPQTLDGGDAEFRTLMADLPAMLPGVTIRFYHRGHWEDMHQPVAATFEQAMVHAGSTLSDAINIMAIQNPHEPVRIAGCPYRGPHGYFYETSEYENSEDAVFLSEKSRRLMWDSFADMRRQGIDIIDCNKSHGEPIPAELRLPQGTLFPKKSLFTRFFRGL